MIYVFVYYSHSYCVYIYIYLLPTQIHFFLIPTAIHGHPFWPAGFSKASAKSSTMRRL